VQNETAEAAVDLAQKGRLAMSVAQAAAEAGVGRDVIYAAIKADSNPLRARRVGRRTLILRTDLAAYLEDLPDLDLKNHEVAQSRAPKVRRAKPAPQHAGA
jgi:excisionase family DNA binding protein